MQVVCMCACVCVHVCVCVYVLKLYKSRVGCIYPWICVTLLMSTSLSPIVLSL